MIGVFFTIFFWIIYVKYIRKHFLGVYVVVMGDFF